MKKYLVATALSLFVLIAPSAQAETQTTGDTPTVKPMPPKKGMGDMEHGGGMKMGKMSSTTDATNGKDSKKKAEKPEMRKAIPGVVTAVTSTGFSMTARGLGKDHASTTLTVVITPTTVIKVRNTMAPQEGKPMMASTTIVTSGTMTPPNDTGSITDIIVGSKVEVFGKVATTTKTITADRIHINSGRSGEMKASGDKGEHMRPGMASTSPNGVPTEDKRVSFIDKMKGFFGSTNGGPAGTGFLSTFWSWFK